MSKRGRWNISSTRRERSEPRSRLSAPLLGALALLGLGGAGPARAEEAPQSAPNPELVDIATLDLEELLDLPIESVSRKAEKSSRAPASVFVISAEDIRRHGYRTVAEAIRSVPGMFVSEDHVLSHAGFRGINVLGDLSQRVLVLLDGHPLNNSDGDLQSYISRDLPVDIWAIERIEVIKGPIGGVYGPTAFFGVINVVTRHDQNGGAITIAGDAAQSAARSGEVGLVYGRKLGDLDIFLDASIYRSSGFDLAFPELELDPVRPAPSGGKVPGADWLRTQNVYGRVKYKDLSIIGGYNYWRRGLPTAPYQVNIGDTRNDAFTGTGFVQGSWERKLSDAFGLLARVSYDDYTFRDSLFYPEDSVVYPTEPSQPGLFHDTARDQWISGELRATFTPFDGHRTTVGAEVQRHSVVENSFFQDLPSAVEDPDFGYGLGDIRKDFWTLNSYLMVEQTLLDMLHLQGGLTFYSHQLFGNRLTPKLALVAEVTEHDTVKAIYTEGFRAPSIFEAFFKDALFYQANPALRPESASSIELVYERKLFGLATLTGSVHQSRYRDLIKFDVVPAAGLDHEPDPNVPSDFRIQADNADSITVLGLDLGLNVRWQDYLHAYGGVAIQRGQFEGSTARGNFAPLTANLALSTRALHPSLTLAVNGVYVSARLKQADPLQPEVEESVDPYLMLNASARWAVPALEGLSTQLSVYNVTGSPATDPIAGDHAPITAVTQVGPQARLTAEYRF